MILLFLWAGGRAAYLVTPLINLAPKPAPVAVREITADRFAIPEPQVQLHLQGNTALAASPNSRGTVRRPRATLRSRMPLEQFRPTIRQAAPNTRPRTNQPRQVEARIDVSSQSGKTRRLSLSSWLLVRDGATGIAPQGTLGGAQLGVRAYIPITPRIAATARVSSPLRSSGAEASVGIALRQGSVTVMLERRIALERGGRNDFSATVAAGVDGVRLPEEFRLDAYGQAGMVGRDAFADGAVRVERRIATHGKSEIALGAGVWGGVQPGLARVDAGPQVVVGLPIASGHLRASGEWRQRIVGDAQPASGPALTLGMDF